MLTRPNPRRSWLAVACGLLAVWAVGLVRFRGWNANDDLAILQLHLERIGDGVIPLVGAYSRLEFHHPGPLREWLFGAAYWVTGGRSGSIPATAVTLNLAWVAAACAAGWQSARRSGLIAAVAGAALLHMGLGWNLHSAWNPYLAVLAAYAAAWGVVAVVTVGGRAWPIPLVAASFAAQQHVSLLALGVAAIIVVGVIAWRERRGSGRRSTVIGLAAVLLWSGPLLDLLNGTDSNVVRLLRGGGDDPSIGAVDAGRHLGRLLLPWSIARGESLRATGADAPTAPLAVGVFAVVALAVLAVRRRGDPAGRSAAVGLGALVLAWVTVAAGFAPPAFPYLFAPTVGALTIITSAFVLAAAPATASLVRRTPVPPPAAGRAVAAAFVVITAVAWIDGGWTSLQPIATAPLQQQIDAAVRAAVAPGEPYTVVGAGLVESVADGEVALAVQQAGGRPHSSAFALGLPPPRPGDRALLVAMGGPLGCLLAAEPGDRLIVLERSSASRLEVGVFLLAAGEEWAAPAACGAPIR